MAVFKNGKDTSVSHDLSGVDEAVRAALEKAGDSLLQKLSKALAGVKNCNNYTRFREETDESDKETIMALAKAASSNIKVESANFSKLGKNEAVDPRINMDDAIGELGDIE